jgi:hypothetical protein
MNAGDLRDAVPEIAERLAELERERERLADLTQAYRVVERSKFSQLQTLAADVKALLGRGRKEAKLFRPAARPAIEPFVETPGNGPVAAANAAIATANGRGAAGLAGTLKRLIDELTLARAGYLDTKDALEAERSQSYAHEPYERFLQLFGVRGTDLDKMREVVSIMPRRPLFSVIMATYDTPERYLRAALDSVRAQVYPDWELCIADDASRDPRVRRILEEYAGFERRIKLTFRSENGHISRASNSALALAQGEFVGFLDHDDLLTPDALFECALAANRMPDVDMLYSDEDKIDDDGEWADPFFKPDWNPDTFLSRMYTCHFGVYRRALVEAIGGLRPEFDGAAPDRAHDAHPPHRKSPVPLARPSELDGVHGRREALRREGSGAGDHRGTRTARGTRPRPRPGGRARHVHRALRDPRAQEGQRHHPDAQSRRRCRPMSRVPLREEYLRRFRDRAAR